MSEQVIIMVLWFLEEAPPTNWFIDLNSEFWKLSTCKICLISTLSMITKVDEEN